MASEVKIKAVLDAEDKASSKVQGFSMSLGKLTAAVGLGTLAADAFKKGIGLATDFLKGSIAAATEEEVVMVKVDAILKTLSGDLNIHREAINRASEAAEKLAFDDEDAAISMAKLMQVTGNTTDAQYAQQVAMDLSRMAGISLEDATKKVTLAYAGSTKLLKEYGIEIPETASKMEMLGLIHDKVKGQAETFATTAAGAQAKFKVSSENLREEVGGMLLPLVTSFYGKINNFVASDTFKGWIEKIKILFNEQFMPAVEKVKKFLIDDLWPVIQNFIIPAWKEAYETIQPYIPVLIDVAKWMGIIFGAAIIGAIILVSNVLAGVIIMFGKMLDIVQEVAKWIQILIDKINKIPKSDWLSGKWVTHFIGKQMGGFVAGGTPYIVGEAGPELFVPSGSGQIVPNNKLGGSSVNINFNNPVVRSENDLIQIIAEVKRVLNRSMVLESLRI